MPRAIKFAPMYYYFVRGRNAFFCACVRACVRACVSSCMEFSPEFHITLPFLRSTAPLHTRTLIKHVYKSQECVYMRKHAKKGAHTHARALKSFDFCTDYWPRQHHPLLASRNFQSPRAHISLMPNRLPLYFQPLI